MRQKNNVRYERRSGLNNIVKSAKRELARLEAMKKEIDDFLICAPLGCLKWQKKKGKIYYYHQFVENSSTEDARNLPLRKYIKRENLFLTKSLAQKHYFISIKPIVEKNIKLLKNLINNYQQDELEKAYESLADERKQLVTPLQTSIEEKRRIWLEEVYKKSDMYPENLRYETEQGDMVRSKSEVIIANILYKHQKNILYKYERPLQVMCNGKIKTLYPDFTVFNLHTGEIKYWEHAGRMDDSYYANEFVKKINTYITNGILPGRDVFLTFETQANPLDIKVVNRTVERMV